MNYHIVLVLLAGFSMCRSKPASIPNVRSGSDQTAAMKQWKNPVDLGVLQKCVDATNIPMGICSKYVDYSVPLTLVSDLSLPNTLSYISSVYDVTYKTEQFDGFSSKKCAEVALKYLCGVYFPKCDASTNRLRANFSFGDCTQEFESKCSTDLRDILSFYAGICYINSTTIATNPAIVDQCNPSSLYASKLREGEGYCSSEVPGWSDVFLTELMLVQLQQVEKIIDGVWHTFSQRMDKVSAKQCTGAYARLACMSVGKCWKEGTHAEMTASREDCEHYVSCAGNKVETGYNCSNYPLQSSIPDTPATPVTTQPTIIPLNSEEKIPHAAFWTDESSSSVLLPPSLTGLLFLSVLMAAGLW